MKASTVKRSELKKLRTFNKFRIWAAIVIIVFLLPTGAVAQSYPAEDQDTSQEGVEMYDQQDSYQQENPDSSETDYSSPYQQPAITESEQDQNDQAKWSLGEPPSRRPEFNNFFDSENRAIISQEEEENEFFP